MRVRVYACVRMRMRVCVCVCAFQLLQKIHKTKAP